MSLFGIQLPNHLAFGWSAILPSSFLTLPVAAAYGAQAISALPL